MSIVTAVDAFINHGEDPEAAVTKLMGRKKKTELTCTVLDMNYETAVMRNAAIRTKGD